MPRSARATSGFQAGEILGQTYRIVRLIGSGGMADVYEAEHLRTSARIAVKVLDPVYSSEPKDIERFKVEARLAASIVHEGIVYVFDIDHDPRRDVWYIAMEFLEGQTLKELLRSVNILPLKRALSIADGVCRALHAVHEKNVIHRDIKPSNIYLASSGDREVVKLLDFGISKIAHGLLSLSMGAPVGTPGYMSPEQAFGDREVDHRSDIFSLAAVVFRMLSGTAPFNAPSVPETITRLLTEDPPSLRARNGEVPPEIERVILKGLAKEPADRFESIGDFREAMLAAGRAAHAEMGLPRRAGLATKPMIAAPSTSSSSRVTAEQWREMRQVTVLSASVEAPAEPSGLPGSAVQDLIGHAARMEAVIVEQGGTLIKAFSGSLIAIFGMPRSMADDAERAVRAALLLRREMAPTGLVLRMGLATGKVLAERLSGEGGRFTVAGKAMNLARRIEGVNETGAVLADQATYIQVRGRFHAQPVAVARGAAADETGLEVIEVLSEHPHGLTVRPREILGRLPPMVGRKTELDHLEALFRAAVADETFQSALVVAPVGMGKSRFVREFRSHVEDSGTACFTLFAEADAPGAAAPLSLVAEMIRQKAQILPGDDAAAARRKIESFVRIGGLAGEDERFVRHVLGLLLQVEPARQGDGSLAVSLGLAFQLFLGTLVKKVPTLIVVEDLHRADQASVDFLLSLRHAGFPRVLLLATLSPEAAGRVSWGDFLGSWKTVMQLQPLTPRESHDLVEAMLGGPPADYSCDDIVALSEGNPLFIEEFIQDLLDRSGLSFGDGGWSVRDRHCVEAVPGRVETIIQSRLDALSASELGLVRKASMCGLVFWDGALEAMGAENLEKGLDALLKRELIVSSLPSRMPGNRQFSFKNELISKVANAGLPQAERLDLSMKLARWLEASGRKP